MAFQGLRHGARYLGQVSVFYPLHPRAGGEFRVFRIHRGCVEVFLNRGRLGIPQWMTDEQRCLTMTYGLQPRCSVRALRELRRLLQQADLS